jgi:anti-anti-sigma regulatory factor
MNTGYVLKVEVLENVVVATIQQTSLIGEAVVFPLSQELFDLALQHKPPFLFDCERLRYLSAPIIRELLTLRKDNNFQPSDLNFCAVKTEIKEIFTLMRVEEFFTWHSCRKTALDTLNA